MSDIHNGIDIEQITVSLGADCAASRKHAMELVEEQEQIPFAKKAPRIPRDNEPAPLWVVCGLVAFVGLCLVLVTGGAMHAVGIAADVAVTYANALVDALLRWIGGAL